MRILHCVTHFSLGGAEEVVLSIVSELHSQATFGVLGVFDTAPNPVGRRMCAELASLGIPFWTGQPRIGHLTDVLRGSQVLTRCIREFRPSIVHLHTELPEACYAAARWSSHRLRGMRVVRTIHNTRYWSGKERVGRLVDRAIGASRIIAVSRGASAAFAAFRDCEADAPEVIHNGVKIQPAGKRMTRPSDGSVRALFAGRLEFQKGADILPTILDRVVLPANTSLHVEVIGEGSYAGFLAASSLSSSGVTLSVHPPLASLCDELPLYDLVLMPSRFEGLGLIAVESLLAGVPVIITDAPGLIETVPNGYRYVARAGDVDSFADVLTAALHSRASWQAEVDAAQPMCRERFSRAHMGRRYLAAYEHMLGDMRSAGLVSH